MEQPKGYMRGKGGKYWVLYQPKDDVFTHITYYYTYEDALEMYTAIKVFHRERQIPVRIELDELATHKRLLEQKIENTP